MNRFIQHTVFACVSMAVMAWPAAALEEHNPLDKLDADKLCEAEQTTPPTTPTLIDLRISKDAVLKTAIGKNMLPPPDDLNTDRSYFDRLVDLVVPCSAAGQAETLEARKKACLDGRHKYTSPESSRYTAKDARVIRQNLLRLFQSSVTGGTKDFIVVRSNRKGDLLVPRDPSSSWAEYGPLRNRLHDDIMLLEYFYAPDIKKHERGKSNPIPSHENSPDALNISTVPFEVFCRKRVITPASAGSKQDEGTDYPFDSFVLPDNLTIFPEAKRRAPNAAVLWNKMALAGKELSLKKEEEKTGAERKFPTDSYPHKPKEWKAIADAMPVPVNTEAVTSEGAEKSGKYAPNKDISYTGTGGVQFMIVESPKEFIKSDRSGLSIGTTLGYNKKEERLSDLGDAEVKVKGAVGLRFIWLENFKWQPYKDNKQLMLETKDEWALTPYLALDLTAASSLDCTLKAPCSDAEDADNKKKSISYGRTSAGLRLDHQFTPAARLQREEDFISPDALQVMGRANSPWGYGAYLEYNSDNYNILSSQLAGLYLNPPAELFGAFGKSLRQNYPLDAYWTSRLYGTINPDPADDAFSGLFFKWDATFVLEHLDYSRLPRDFEKVPTLVNDRFLWPNKQVIEGMSYGMDASVTLARYNFLSLGEDDLTAKFNVALVSRRSFDNGNSADKLTYKLTLSDPENAAKRTWDIAFTKGEDPITGAQEESISFNLTFAH